MRAVSCFHAISLKSGFGEGRGFYGPVDLIQFPVDKFLVPRKRRPIFMFMYVHRHPCFLQIYGFAVNKPQNLRLIVRMKP